MQELEKGQIAKIKLNISPVRSIEIACKIAWVESDRLGLIYPKDKFDFALYFHEGKEVEAIIYSDKGIYVFEPIIIDSPYETDFVIELPEEKKKIQRREYVRVPINLLLFLFDKNQKNTCETINIGGGGVRFESDKEYKIDLLCDFSIYLPEWKDPINGNCKILYTFKQDNRFISAAKFINLNEFNRNKIIKLCFEEEANILKMRYTKPKN